MSGIDSILFKRAKEILREHHNNFSELKTCVRQMLMDDLGIDEPDDDIVGWVSHIIRSEDWKSFSAQRIKGFSHGDGEDFMNWISYTLIHDEPTDSWYKPYQEKAELTEAVTLEDKLTIGMRGSYWLGDSDNAENCLKSAIEELKASRFEPAKDFLFADYYLEMVSNGRYDECCDLITVLHNIALDDLSKERVLAQAIGVSMRCGRLDIAELAVNKAAELEAMQREILPFNIACYFATAGNDEEQMWDYIQLAVQNGKSSYDFNDSDFDAHRHKIMFKTLIRGGTREKAETAMQAVGSQAAPKTPEEAVALISRLREAADSIDPRNSDDENVISKYFGIECDSYGFPAEVPPLDDILKDFGQELPAKSFVDLFVIAFYSMEANYQVALSAVSCLADSESQMQIADAFMKAGSNYDAGHRAEDNTVHDQLIDRLFIYFNDDALIYLLEICDTQYLAADGMAQLFIPLLKRDPAEDIKQRAYDCLIAMYEKEGGTDYYYYQFQSLFARLAPMLPTDILKKIEAINPDLWGKFELGSGKEIGLTDVLIKSDCDYAFYAHRDKMQKKFDLMIFTPDGTMKNIDIYQPLAKAAIMEWYGEFGNSTWTSTQQYTFWSEGKQVCGNEQGDRIESSGGRWTYQGGFNENGELVLTVTCGEHSIGIYTYQYAGYSKNGELFLEAPFNGEAG